MKVEYYNSFQTFTDTFSNLIDVNKCISITIINQSQRGELYIGGIAFFIYPQSSITIEGNELEQYQGKLNLLLDSENALNPYYIVIKKLQINETAI
jgi:hypothetical protein